MLIDPDGREYPIGQVVCADAMDLHCMMDPATGTYLLILTFVYHDGTRTSYQFPINALPSLHSGLEEAIEKLKDMDAL